MFFYSTFSKFQHAIELYNLAESNNPQWLKQVAEWAEKQWGYIRNFPGVEYRKSIIEKCSKNFYVITYSDILIGMFALFDGKSYPNIKIIKLEYFYIDERFRGLGVGRRIIDGIKSLYVKNQDLIILDTLHPRLNAFYKKCGFKELCEHQLLGYPVTVMKLFLTKSVEENKKTSKIITSKKLTHKQLTQDKDLSHFFQNNLAPIPWVDLTYDKQDTIPWYIHQFKDCYRMIKNFYDNYVEKINDSFLYIKNEKLVIDENNMENERYFDVFKKVIFAINNQKNTDLEFFNNLNTTCTSYLFYENSDLKKVYSDFLEAYRKLSSVIYMWRTFAINAYKKYDEEYINLIESACNASPNHKNDDFQLDKDLEKIIILATKKIEQDKLKLLFLDEMKIKLAEQCEKLFKLRYENNIKNKLKFKISDQEQDKLSFLFFEKLKAESRNKEYAKTVCSSFLKK
ncbi:MAG: hypothetical protein Tsb005_18390 [Gammaproteobacteria bacterium]